MEATGSQSFAEIVMLVQGKAISDRDRLVRLRSYVAAQGINGTQAAQLVSIFNKCDSKTAVEAGVIMGQALTSADDRALMLAAYKYAEDRANILQRLAV